MADRATMIRNVAVGDFFHARSPNRASLICLATSVGKTTIHARRITSQEELEFDRQTGFAKSGNDQVPCEIDSVAPLPAEIHDVFLEMDRRYRVEHDLERFKLTDAAKRALLFIHSYYPAHPV